MCCYSCSGQSVPLFVIVKNLQNCPDDLRPLIFGTEGIVVASSSNGYMAKDLFLAWCIHFITFLSLYRTTLPPNIRRSSALLYLDGHFSRYSPLSFLVMKTYNIEVIILPPMVTHFFQPFDFTIAFALKAIYDRNMRKLKAEISKDYFNSEISWTRYLTIMAFRLSWVSFISPTSAFNSFNATGLFPCNENKPISESSIRTWL